ncbi:MULTISPECIES: DUF4142 domain-containing protein [Pseudomonas]|uniref:Membrane protein n=2 Tax=Pseudomonadaceae TaxID=135621 RepID=A0A0D0KYI7_9PSED|nr:MULTISPECIES: DUF4142 domain-containing protein [Pseudomonas]KIQ03537.1 membrane protein [Pseudomonas fulva]
MKQSAVLLGTALALLLGLSNATHAASQITPEDFAEEASAKGIAEIETGKLALEKGTRDEVKKFAQTMVDDHTRANEELKALAEKKQLKISTDADLMNQAKAKILQVREGESFDDAYANNQVEAHEQAIELYEKAAASEDAELSAWAKEVLPKLKHHLEMARDLRELTHQRTPPAQSVQ